MKVKVLRLFKTKWQDKEKVAKVLEEKEKSEPRGPQPKDTPEPQLKESPNPLSEDSPEEVVSRESHHSSMMTPDTSLRDSLRVSSEMQLPTLSMPEEKPSPLWT